MDLALLSAKPHNLTMILRILTQAKEYLAEQGSPQWQEGHGPGQAEVERDLARKEGYVLLFAGKLCGYAALASGVEENYLRIREGAWDDSAGNYLTVHRMALDASVRGQGLAKPFLRELVIASRALGYRDIRIDTHEQNKAMQKVILSVGFVYKGLIDIPIPNGERKAYQLLLP